MEGIYTTAVLLKVVFFFGLLYMLIPSRIIIFDESGSTFLDKVFISLTHSSFVIILLVHLLAFLSLYETISIVFAFLVFYVAVVWVKGRSPSALADVFGYKTIVSVLDVFEGSVNFKAILKTKLADSISALKDKSGRAVKVFLARPFAGVLLLIVLGAAAYIRFKHSFEHLYFGASDTYVNLAWIKYLGNNDIYRDGIYPYGYHAIISVLHKVFFVDPYLLLRFIGPLAGFLIVLSLYYILKKNFHGEHTAWLGVLLYGVMIDPRLPADVWRQMSALAMEYAYIFLLPGLHFFNMYLNNKKISYLILAGECVSLTLLIHPYVTVFLGIGYILIFLINIFKTGLRRIIYVAGVMIGAILVGVLPLAAAYLIGMKFHGSLGYIQGQVAIPDQGLPAAPSGAVFFQDTNPLLVLLFISAVIVIFVCLAALLLKKRNILTEGCSFGLSSVLLASVLYILFRADMLGLPKIMDTARVGIFLSIVTAAVYAMTLTVFDLLPVRWQRTRIFCKSVVCLIVLVLVLAYTPFNIPEGHRMEYDETVKAYLNIRQRYPALNWTIIAPVEQYQQSLGYGWHYELWEFVHKLEGRESEKLTMATDYVFLFVEKQPLYSEGSIEAEDAEKPFPPVPELVSDIYAEPESRRIIEAKAFAWAEEYMENYENMSVYFDGEYLRVYLLVQDGTKPVDLRKH